MNFEQMADTLFAYHINKPICEKSSKILTKDSKIKSVKKTNKKLTNSKNNNYQFNMDLITEMVDRCNNSKNDK